MKKLQIIENGYFVTKLNDEGEVLEKMDFTSLANEGKRLDVITVYDYNEKTNRLKTVKIQDVSNDICNNYYIELLKVVNSRLKALQDKYDNEATIELKTRLESLKAFNNILANYVKGLKLTELQPLENSVIAIILNIALPSIFASDEYKGIIDTMDNVFKCGTMNGKEFEAYHKAINTFVKAMNLDIMLNKSTSKHLLRAIKEEFALNKKGVVIVKAMKKRAIAKQVTFAILQGVQAKKAKKEA